jgi:hypothetical protein
MAFWLLFLAHLLGDYPLQPNWLVAKKRHPWALFLHVVIHFVLMFALMGQARLRLLPQLLVLTIAHFILDASKITISSKRPVQIGAAYLIDQAIHLVLIAGTAFWIESVLPGDLAFQPSAWPALGCGYVLVTSAWSATERILTEHQPSYNQEVLTQAWPRNLARAGLFTLWLLLAQTQYAVIPILAVNLPYLSGQFRKRALLTDLAVTFVAAVITTLANISLL